MPTQTITQSAGDGSNVVGGSAVATGASAVAESFTTDGTATPNQLFTGASIIQANLQSLAIDFRDANGNYLAVTLKTNSSGSPQDTITFAAGAGPLVWKKGCGLAVPIAGNVTAWYVSPVAAVAGTLRIMATFN